jgi:hypothetical protein
MPQNEMEALWFSQLLDRLSAMAAPTGSAERSYLPLHQATMPLLGFLGPQQTPATPDNPYGGFATWLNTSMGHRGQEWLVPLLTPNQDHQDVKALLSGVELTPEQDQRIYSRAWQFARQYETENPGTFAKYPTSIEATAAALGPSKNLLYRFPPVAIQYPGR